MVGNTVVACIDKVRLVVGRRFGAQKDDMDEECLSRAIIYLVPPVVLFGAGLVW